VIARRADSHYQQQESADSSEIAEGFHGKQRLVVSGQKS
jgi:hypothetical protein